MTGCPRSETRTRDRDGVQTAGGRDVREAQRSEPRASTGGDEAPDVSVVVVVSERPERLTPFYNEVSEALRAAGIDFELTFVLQPKHRSLADPLSDLIEDGEPIRVMETGQAMGEAALVKTAATRSRAPLLLTLPAYYRVDAAVLPELVCRVEEGADMATARRWPRRDSWLNRLQGRAFHFLLRLISGVSVNDVACGVRAMRRRMLEEIPLYGDFFRFLPVLARREGYRVEEVDSPQHPRDRETRIYSPGVYLRRLLDLLGVFFLLRFTYKPLRFFGLVGSTLGAVGGSVLLVLLVQRLGGQGIADRPMLLLGVLLVTLGVQAVALGLVGEIIVHLNVPRRTTYRVRDEPEAS